jgi:hypothetical protein
MVRQRYGACSRSDLLLDVCMSDGFIYVRGRMTGFVYAGMDRWMGEG